MVARVWIQKLRALLHNLDEGVFGRILARIYVVEFQKRGLPHAHSFIIVADKAKPRTGDLINKLVSCEIPDEVQNMEIYETVMNCMMHGPCGNQHPNCVCMIDGKCSKGYPKPLVEVTLANVDGYAEVQRCRRPPGELKFKNREYDNATANQWVVPYNPTFITVVKYMYQYVYKGSDKAMFTIESVENERECACIRLLDYVVQGKSHSVVLLPVHLKGRHMVLFRVDEDPEEVLERTNHSMLTRFFELCASDDPVNQIAKTMLYQDIPKKFTWKNGRWVRLQKFQLSICRMNDVSPRDMERFYLRVMLCNRRGPTSFEDLRTVSGIEYPSYLDAVKAAGHLENDGEWIACMEEAKEYKMPYQLRQLFATLLAYSMPTDVRGMWNQFYTDLSEDYAHTFRDMSEPHKSKTVLDSDLAQVVHTEAQLNNEQRAIYNQIIGTVNQPEQGKKKFFIDGPGGTGKSTLHRNILAKVRLESKIAIDVASSGIASFLLMGSRTAHSTSTIPLKLNEFST
ncbi:Helitron helicase [Phytophthora megakarya]|uniref:ATP-dependent DNA helicase n=1 Tax=Phytophthora megakarya TaxID=4795 RepID=A0A225VNI7_9STRA|nr:Helitron helicase [Phytophthora megakarya]